MVSNNTDPKKTAFTVSIDYKHGTSTGISAADRALTIRAMADPGARPEDFTRPGHVFPLRYRPGGVLKRAGHTEATVDLSRLAGLYPAGCLCEVSGLARGSAGAAPAARPPRAGWRGLAGAHSTLCPPPPPDGQ